MIHKKRSTKERNLLEEARWGGTVVCDQPYGKEGLLIAEGDLDAATGMLAKRCK